MSRRSEKFVKVKVSTSNEKQPRKEKDKVISINSIQSIHPYPKTDLGNAEYFVRKYRGKLKYDFTRKKWLAWKSPLWTPDETEHIVQMVKDSIRERRQLAEQIDNRDERNREIHWTLQSESAAKIDHVLKLSRSDPSIATRIESWDIDNYLLGSPSGIIDLRNGNLLKPSSDHLLTMRTNVEYKEKESCPLWLGFLEQVWPDKDVRDYVSKCVGYSLTGDTKEQCLFALFGSGANGKSVFLETIKRILGDYAYTMPFATIEFQDRNSVSNDVAALARRRFVAASETQENVRLNEGRIKMLTGDEEMTARFLHKEFFSFLPTAKYWIAFNHKPRVIDDSFGFWRRLKLIEFTQTFVGKRQDKNLLKKLMNEASGILNWAVEQCLSWQKDGLKEPQVVIDATSRYRKESNPLGEFLEECCEINDEHIISKTDLFEEYLVFSKKMGEKFNLSSKGFSQRLLGMGMKEDRWGHDRQRVWVGIGLKGRISVYNFESKKNKTLKNAQAKN